MRTPEDYLVLVAGVLAVCVFYALSVAALHTATHPQPQPQPQPQAHRLVLDTPDCTAPGIIVPNGFVGCPDSFHKDVDNI